MTTSVESKGRDDDEEQQVKDNEEEVEDPDAFDTDDEAIDTAESEVADGGEENNEEDFIVSLTPTANDIFCGRGRGIGSKPGNEKYIKLISAKRAEYLNLRKNEKQKYAEQVLEEISTLWSPPGRFLEHLVDPGEDGEDEKWKILSTKRIIVKICTALRKGPKSNAGRKKAQEAKKKQKLLDQDVKNNRTRTFSSTHSTTKKQGGTGSKIKQNQQATVAAREQRVGGERQADKTGGACDGKSPAPSRRDKRSVASSYGNDKACGVETRRVAQKTAHPASILKPSSPFSSKEAQGQRGGPYEPLHALHPNASGEEVHDKKLSSNFTLSTAVPVCMSSTRIGSGTATAGLKEAFAGDATKLAGSPVCCCGGICRSVPATLNLLVEASAPQRMCSQILASQMLCATSLSPSMSLSLPPYAVSGTSGFPSPVNLASAIPAFFLRAEQGVQQQNPRSSAETTVSGRTIETLPNARSLLQTVPPNKICCPVHPLTFPVMHNGTAAQDSQQSLAAALLLAATRKAPAATATFGGSSSPLVPSQRGTTESMKVTASCLDVLAGNERHKHDRDEDNKEPSPEPVVSSHSPSEATKPSASSPHHMRDQPPVPEPIAESQQPPSCLVQEGPKSMGLKWQDEKNDGESFERRSASPAVPVLSSVGMLGRSATREVNVASAKGADDGELDTRKDDVFGDADEDSVLHHLDRFHFSGTSMGTSVSFF